MENLNPGLIVIGGYNRAGKTTFMQLMKSLGFGFKKTTFPLASKYEVDADVLLENGDLVNLQINGLREPQVNFLKEGSKNISLKDIYGNLDQFTYGQLFTISLDELQRIPAGVSKEKTSKLQSVLLGAGLSQIVKIPQLEEEMNKNAERIGGKYGRVNVGSFKPYFEQLKKAEEINEKAIMQTEEYYKLQRELETLTKKIENLENEKIPSLKRELKKINIIKGMFTTLKDIFNLKLELQSHSGKNIELYVKNISLENVITLKEEYEKLNQELKQKLQQFREELACEVIERTIEKLIALKREINDTILKLSGLRERVKNVLARRNALQMRKIEIQSKIRKINENWEDNFDFIKSLRIDKIDRSNLLKIIKKYEEVTVKIKNYEKEVLELEEKGRKFEQEFEEYKKSNSFEFELKRYFLISLFFLTIGIIVAFNIPLVGFMLSIFGIISCAIYFISKNSHYKELEINKGKIQDEFIEIENKLRRFQRLINELKQEKVLLDESILEYKNKLGIKEEVSTDILLEIYRDVQEIRNDIFEWEKEWNHVKKEQRILEKDLYHIAEILNELSVYIKKIQPNDFTAEEIIFYSEDIFSQVEQAEEYLEFAENLISLEKAKFEKEIKIKKLLSISDDINLLKNMEKVIEEIKVKNKYNELKARLETTKKTALYSLRSHRLNDILEEDVIKNDEELLMVFEKWTKEYTSEDEVKHASEKIAVELELNEKKAEKLKEQIQELKLNLKGIAGSETIITARQMIHDARAELRPLAEKYAVYKAASYILKKIREKAIERLKNETLKSASEILNKITRGEYIEIQPKEMVSDADFKVVQNNNTYLDSTEILSRGTKEQLFLAVRLGRILEIEQPLPVIIDDSLVNFDLPHLKSVLEIFTSLSYRNQVFILTCHPEVIEIISQIASDVQFWQLERGKFKISDEKKLISYLQDGRS